MKDEASPFEIFRPGERAALNGQTYSITEDDLRKTAEFYDPAVHEAPFVKGHPRTDDPAFGWVGSVEYSDGALRVIDRRQVEPAFAEDVRTGRFKKRSASFWPPNHPSNPTPGIWALKHVGFLGAAPPAVKGMPDVAGFAEDEDGIVVVTTDTDGAEFADPGLADDMASVFRRFREWVIDRFSKDEADDLIPEFMIRGLERQALADDALDTPAYTDPNEPEPDPMADPNKSAQGKTQRSDTSNKTDEAAFAERENAIADREAKIAAREQAAAAAEAKASQAETASFVDGLVDSGQVLPRDREFLVEFVAGLDNEPVEFSDSDEKTVSVNRRDGFKKFLENLPEQVDYAERAGADGDDDVAVPVAEFGGPDRLPVDNSRAEMYRKAKAHAAKAGVSFAEAVRAVGG